MVQAWSMMGRLPRSILLLPPTTPDACLPPRYTMATTREMAQGWSNPRQRTAGHGWQMRRHCRRKRQPLRRWTVTGPLYNYRPTRIDKVSLNEPVRQLSQLL